MTMAFKDNATPEEINQWEKTLMEPIEQHLKTAIAYMRQAQEEILFPCGLYSQLDDMQSALTDIIESKSWEGKV